VNTALSVPESEHNADHKAYFERLVSLEIAPEGMREECKGLLVVGTFRSTPLSERVNPDIPAPIVGRLPYLDVCVLTGAQLFGLVMQVREDPTLKGQIVKELFETRGVLGRALDWTDFLSKPL
jgi:hypothetical protein